MNKNHILFLFLVTICIGVYSQANEPYDDIRSTEARIQELIIIISLNLKGTSVYEQFTKEQKLWEAYRDAHIETLYPDFIDGVKMEWGSILGYDISLEILKLNIDRIKFLESFFNNENNTGTDGRGFFKEYVDELREAQRRQPIPE